MMYGAFLDSEACIRQDVLDPFSQDKVTAYQNGRDLRFVPSGKSMVALMDAVERHGSTWVCNDNGQMIPASKQGPGIRGIIFGTALILPPERML